MTPIKPHCDVEVVVCGAGPVGLTAAALLAARGIEVVVLEQNDSTSDEPKAISIDDEALRVFQQAGIVDQIMPVLVPGTGTRYYDRAGTPLFHAKGPQPFRLGFPFKNPFAQPDLERVLADAVTRAPNVTVRFGNRVSGFDQHPDHVSVHVETATGASTVTARYVLGCDGGRSATRLLQDIDMTGRSHDQVWLVADTVEDPHTERFAMHHGDPDRPHVIVPGLHGRCRYEFRLFDGEGDPQQPPDFELIRKLVSRYRVLEPHHVERAVNYRFNAVVADEWMIGRSFLLGDAAHMMPPFAGQGLNSGIRDAANLCWKIADVLAGILDADVLASYQRERFPHALATVRMSERLGRVVMTTSPSLAARRDRRVAAALATEDGRAYLEQMRYRPPQHYIDGLVVPGDLPAHVGVPLGQPLVFDTATHSVCRLDRALGTGWSLIGIDVGDEHWQGVETILTAFDATAAQLMLADHMPGSGRRALIDVDHALNSEFIAYTGRFVLLRPDHFVAAAWTPDHTEDVIDRVLSWTPGAVVHNTPRQGAVSHG